MFQNLRTAKCRLQGKHGKQVRIRYRLGGRKQWECLHCEGVIREETTSNVKAVKEEQHLTYRQRGQQYPPYGGSR